MPVEILTSILKYDCIAKKDLRAVAGTCRYLRAVSPVPPPSSPQSDESEVPPLIEQNPSSFSQVASPLLFKEMSFLLEKLASLHVLQALKTNPQKAAIVESA